MADSLFGRRKIFTTASTFTAENIVKELNDALSLHAANCLEEEYLYWYRRGVQPVLNRKKEIRPEICNKVVVNNAGQVVDFKNGYFLTQPAFYRSRKEDSETADKVKRLNEYLYTSGKQQADNSVVDWFHTVGLGVVLVEPNKKNNPNKPVCVYALDPRSAFVVYSRKPGNRPVMGVNVVMTGKNQAIYDVFTETAVYHISGGYGGESKTDAPVISTAMTVLSVEPNPLGLIPMVEYSYNGSRMGAFERAVSAMDAYNLVESMRLDGIDQFIQSLAVAVNCDFEDDVTANTIRQAGLIKLKTFGENKADFKILSEQLDQSQTQVTLDDLYEQILAKCGVPSTMKGSSSTSDTGTAVYLRDGYAIADTCARNTEDIFKQANAYFDEIFLEILRRKVGFEIDPADFELQFVRNATSNLLVKSQAALNLKQLGMSPEIALARSGISNDPVADVANSQKYIDAVWGAEQPQEQAPTQDGSVVATT